jgi:type IV pilus assembly protein PilO
MKMDMTTIMKRLQSLSPGALIGIMIGAILVFGLAGWFLLLRPQGAKVNSLNSQATEVKAKIDAYHQQVAAVRAAPKIEVADVYRLAKAMPDRTDMPDLLLELSQLARDTGIRFDSISPQAIAPIGSYAVLPISVTFQGNFYNLADFLYRLRSLVTVHAGRLDATGRLFSVDTLTFNESTLKFPQIQATLVIDAFVYGTGIPAPVATPTPPTTPTTTTTSTTSTITSTSTTTPAASSGASATGAP